MAEPHSTAAASAGVYSITALAFAASGPVVGSWLLLLLAAFLGGYFAATRKKGTTVMEAFVLITRGIGAAVVFSGLIAHLIGLAVNVPGLSPVDYMSPVAFLIALQPESAIQWLRQRLGFGAAKEEPK